MQPKKNKPLEERRKFVKERLKNRKTTLSNEMKRLGREFFVSENVIFNDWVS